MYCIARESKEEDQEVLHYQGKVVVKIEMMVLLVNMLMKMEFIMNVNSQMKNF